jgi:CMP-N-acetylneuraminic acid synthetase
MTFLGRVRISTSYFRMNDAAKKILALIPARGGSKRLPRKNILMCSGRPLIVHTIAAAQAVRPALGRIVVSTDDAEIAEVSRCAGLDVPFIRPAALAADSASSLEVVRHALQWFETDSGWKPEWVLLLQPTSPLRQTSDIEAAIAIATSKKCDSVISVVQLQHQHPNSAKRIENGFLEAFYPESHIDKAPAYANNGAIYLTRTSIIRDLGSLYGKYCRPYVMLRERSVDIDTAVDLQVASFLLDSMTHGPGHL